MKTDLEKLFGTDLCSDEVLKKLMPRKAYSNYMSIKEKDEPLDRLTAKEIAKAIKKWALGKGASHYSHWFLPLTGKTAEKQVSFLETSKDGKFIEDFDEKALTKGETDASSFPNGGDRMTFEARGYTVWDYTSPVFIKADSEGNKVVYIPTAFCSYNGTALDEKTPLLRAIESLNVQSLRILRHLGYNDVKKVICHVGAEQEYFLVKKDDYDKRMDLKVTGRTLLGANAVKSQELHSHYFGMIDDPISVFMNEVDKELWKMGITAKIQHNEVAPAQHEFVPIFSQVNIASDQNQTIMDVISKVAKKHNLAVLFHEKPFANINGSGKHINWSISTDTGIKLLDCNLKDKSLFLVFFVAMISAIDRYYKLLRTTTAYRSNDLRLGGEEAPPALISIFIGDNLQKILDSIGTDNKEKDAVKILDTRVKTLPKMIKDYCDRNRTSPFAYGGNKFEFRMVGSSQSIAFPSTCVCTIVAKILKEMADELDKTNEDKNVAILKILKDNIIAHKRIIFNGNGYDKAWKTEAEKRGLVEYKDSISSYETLKDDDILELFESTDVLDSDEINLRLMTLKKNYYDSVSLEARTLIEMLNKTVYPCYNSCIEDLSKSINTYTKKNDPRVEIRDNFYNAYVEIDKKHKTLISILEKAEETSDIDKKCLIARDEVIKVMEEIRKIYDNLECYIPTYLKPFPFYNDMLFNN